MECPARYAWVPAKPLEDRLETSVSLLEVATLDLAVL
jgi:hypothetical protein